VDIRPAVSADIPQLLALIRRYWQFEGITGFNALRVELVLQQLLAGPAAPGVVWVAEADAALQGYLIVALVLSVEHQGLMGEIDELFVMPQARSQGVGSELLAAAAAALAQRGCVRLQLQLGAGNEPARVFYQRRAFRRRAGFELWGKPLP
jgi:GNAT superfamily N-acetyltransferase